MLDLIGAAADKVKNQICCRNIFGGRCEVRRLTFEKKRHGIEVLVLINRRLRFWL